LQLILYLSLSILFRLKYWLLFGLFIYFGVNMDFAFFIAYKVMDLGLEAAIETMDFLGLCNVPVRFCDWLPVLDAPKPYRRIEHVWFIPRHWRHFPRWGVWMVSKPWFSYVHHSTLIYNDILPYWAQLRRWGITHTAYWLGHRVSLETGFVSWTYKFWRTVFYSCPGIFFDIYLRTTFVEFLQSFLFTHLRAMDGWVLITFYHDTSLAFLRKYWIGQLVVFFELWYGLKFFVLFWAPYVVHFIDRSLCLIYVFILLRAFFLWF